MCRGELSAVITRLMFKCLWSGWKRKALSLPLQSCNSWMFVKEYPDRKKKLFFTESIFKYEKITLLRWECRKRFKVTLIPSRILWLVVDASIRGPIYLFNMLSARSYYFQNTYNIFCNNTIFRKYFFCWVEENKYARNKSEASQKTSVDEDTDSNSREITWSPIFLRF